MSNQNIEQNDVNGAGTFVNVPRPAGAPLVSRVGPVVIMLLLKILREVTVAKVRGGRRQEAEANLRNIGQTWIGVYYGSAM